jgi:23S rRNA (cytidine2498-2'-O)-methyltransferase
VVAVDRASLAGELETHSRLRHLRQSAFSYRPEEPVDWLLCDMAWRPLEVAALLARWGRQGWALHLVANLKLPMRDKVPTLVRARALLEAGGWKAVRLRQLYHDRDEVTVLARSR